MLQTLEHQRKELSIVVLGQHHLPPHLRKHAVSFRQLVIICKTHLPDGRFRVFHARRNDEIIQALILKHLFSAKIKILFTSTAQRYHSRFTRFLISKTDSLISTCQAAASYLEQKPEEIIPHGIDTETYTHSNERSDGASIEIGIFGRVRKQKGSDIFVKAAIDALKKHENVNATIVGAIAPDQQDFVKQLQKEIDQAGLSKRIKFTGELPFDNIPTLFRKMDLVLALSLNEGFGLTVLEAMSSGCAVLTSDAGAWPDIVASGVHGDIVKAGDLKATKEALTQLLSDRARLKKMGEAGRSHVLQHYKIEQESRALCSIYKRLQASTNTTQ